MEWEETFSRKKLVRKVFEKTWVNYYFEKWIRNNKMDRQDMIEKSEIDCEKSCWILC